MRAPEEPVGDPYGGHRAAGRSWLAQLGASGRTVSWLPLPARPSWSEPETRAGGKPASSAIASAGRRRVEALTLSLRL